jgi:hypothetical protein
MLICQLLPIKPRFSHLVMMNEGVFGFVSRVYAIYAWATSRYISRTFIQMDAFQTRIDSMCVCAVFRNPRKLQAYGFFG